MDGGVKIDLGIDVDIEYCLGDEEPEPGLHVLIVAAVQLDGATASRWTMLRDVVRSELDLPARGYEFWDAGRSIGRFRRTNGLSQRCSEK